jgi:tetratricopeptide (TPR) repeat protein
LLAVTVRVLSARKHRYLEVGWFWFMGTLVPMIGLVQVGEAALADRYAYLPLVGLFLMVCWGIADWAAWRKIAPRILAIPAVIAVLVLFAMTRVQLGYWADNVALWSHTVAVTGPNFVAQDNLGGALLLQGDLEAAMPHFRAAAEINPRDPLSTLNLANYELQHGRLPAAIDLYRRVPQITANENLRSHALSGIGSAYRQQGKSHDAEEAFKSALQLVPGNAQAWIGLGLLAQKTGDFAQATSRFSRAVEIEPSDVGYLLLAQALERNGQAAEAQAATQSAQQLSGDLNAARQEAGELLAQ